MGGYIGLDYTAVIGLLELEGAPRRIRRKLLDDLGHIERGALDELAKRAASRGAKI